MAIMVSTRLWLGGVVSQHRDLSLIRALVAQVRAVALCRPLLVAVDGLASYVTAFQQAFRSPVPRFGQAGRCKLRAWSELALVQVVKQRRRGYLSIERRIVQGTQAMVTRLVKLSQGRGGINTAYIERLNATFRQRLASLARRTRFLARQPETLHLGMYVIGCVYDLCTCHHSLRQPFYPAPRGRRWLRRIPATPALHHRCKCCGRLDRSLLDGGGPVQFPGAPPLEPAQTARPAVQRDFGLDETVVSVITIKCRATFL
jgi:hypothetical protein